MRPFALVSLLAAGMTAFLGICIFLRSPRRSFNQVFFLYCLAGAVASFGEFGCRQARSYSSALFWLRVSSIGILAVPLVLHFILYLIERTAWADARWVQLSLYLPAMGMVLLDLSGATGVQPVEVYWGWTYTPPRQGLVTATFAVWFIGLSFLSFYLCLSYYIREVRHRKRHQVAFVFLGTALTVALALITEPGGVLYSVGVVVPELTSVGFLVQCVLLAYAIQRYGLFMLTPATAAESILAAMVDGLFLVDIDARIERVNQAALDLVGYHARDLLGKRIREIVTPESVGLLKRAWVEGALEGGGLRDEEATLVTQDGRPVPVSFSVSIVRDEDDLVQGMVLVCRDLTERKQAEQRMLASLQEKEILLEEIHHRVKNNLQMISGLLLLQAEGSDDKRAVEALRESRNRVHSMAVVHEALYHSSQLNRIDFAQYVHELVNHLSYSYDAHSQMITVTMDVAQVALGVDVAIYCGLILNELVSNALKHAFPGDRLGEIRIELEQMEGGHLLLVVSDNGVGLPADVDWRQAKTLGLQLVIGLVDQLGAVVELDDADGTTFRILIGP